MTILGEKLKAKGFSNREVEVLELVYLGLSSIEIANRLFICDKSVRFHFTSIYRKLNLRGCTGKKSKLIVWLAKLMKGE